jgi:hypothetical protein
LATVAIIVLAVATACGGDDTNGSTPTNTDTGGGSGSPADQSTTTVPAGARQANLLEDPSAFLGRFSQEILAEKECSYDESNGVVDCSNADAGLIELVPDIPVGTDIECRVLLSRETPVGVRCKGQDPLFAAIYELEE